MYYAILRIKTSTSFKTSSSIPRNPHLTQTGLGKDT
ncbi:hypothetical protein G647_01487 [Cladophialophora carrionii CBS 160.54]|uniref:Uncharacterized protein n=1 Tax=Cladophialophora carrionii CBS 160.54 TaxID=1279043 RepID=V9DQ41_9EURO|nr:uncharacterized protein G647_01487 [Cladophialophora carrionii CBS 160.54]ETI29034.1 hypothetical protein G647_01487 [Cladophialophora carrionii CBS 160.54]